MTNRWLQQIAAVSLIITARAMAAPSTCVEAASPLPTIFKSFSKTTKASLEAWIDFTPEEIAEMKAAVKEYDYIGGDMTIPWYRTGNSPEPQFPWEFSQSVKAKLTVFMTDLRQSYKAGTGIDPAAVRITLRLTSNTYGFSIRPGGYADGDGLHTHDDEGTSFVWALDGIGARHIENGKFVDEPQGRILIFGGKVRHGSPSRATISLLIVGNIAPWVVDVDGD